MSKINDYLAQRQQENKDFWDKVLSGPGLVVADYAQLLEDVRAVVRHELHHAPAAPAAPADELLSIREAAELLGVTVQTVHEWKRVGRLSYHKLGGRSYLKRAEVLAALTPHQRPP